MSCKRTARRPPPRLVLDLDGLAFGGDAVGRDAGGRVVFVPGGAPGDRVEVELEEERKGYARARLARVIRPGARVDPPCPRYLAGCGGCQWQHVALEAQRAAKADVVARALRRAGPVEPLLAPAPAFGWRRRARLRYRGGRVGYAERRSHRLVDVDACPQLEPALDDALRAVRGLGLEGAGELELLVTGRGEVHVAISGAAAGSDRLVGQAGIAGVFAGGRDHGAARVDLADDARPFFTRADVFAQATAAGNRLLRDLVLAGAGPLAGRRVLELHAGSGNFTRDLARAAAHVTAVEESAAALALAAENLAGLPVELRNGPAERAGASGYDVIVVDPPRAGLDPALAASLAGHPGPLVYVSCDPSTLGRDLALLGRRLVRATPLDLMPQTFHVEVVTVLAPT
jgi:23S rRNA (uracil1939-C5)-methyltransferase